ncbi:MAG: hypothetical protein ABI145_15670 [Steroidobacteraceae bacterium]
MEAVIKLSSQYDEAQLQKLVSDGRLSKVFPFTPKKLDMPADFVAEEDFVQASPKPLNCEQRAALIQSSMPAAGKKTTSRRLRELPDFIELAPSKKKAMSSSND